MKANKISADSKWLIIFPYILISISLINTIPVLRTDLSNTVRSKRTHWKFTQIAAQFHAFIRKPQASAQH